ncbi:MAG TPA: DoxX family protein [Burkholderiales bacterium]|nr:DoxX family protein [Burkholderiales bacterium]
MYEKHSALQAAGQLLLALSFLVTGIRNALWKFGQHEERMRALGVPRPRAVLVAGFILQFTGAAMLALDVHRVAAAWMLAAFTILASLIFHRWWLIPDALVRHLHIANLLVNLGLLGGLMLVIAL